MIICYLFGGIGNQIFQFLSALNLSYREKRKLIFDYSLIYGFKNYHKVKITDIFDFKKYKNLEIRNNKSQNFFLLKTKIIFFNICRKFNFIKRVINEDNFYNKLKKNIKYYQFGYFQDLKYIQSSFLNIRNILVFKKYFYKNKSYKNLSNKPNSVCLHIRRGDYLSKKSRLKYEILNEKYFQKAISLMRKKLKKPFFFIFSDDIEYSSSFVKKNFIKDKYQLINTYSDVNDFFLMAQCKNFILSNSTFSWWCSYLSSNKNKIIICPKLWFVKDIDNNNNNLILKSWIKI